MKETNRNVNHRAAFDPARCLRRAPRGRGPELPVLATGARGDGLPRLDFRLARLPAWAARAELTTEETLWVLLNGPATLRAGGRTVRCDRASLFDEGPVALHCGPGEPVTIAARGRAAEFAVLRAGRSALRGVHWSAADACAIERRGAGLVQGACERVVRTIFDHASRPQSNLVVGEVVNLPGRWSSYPPHHHPQPEIYHYRFTDSRGYGHAELGDAVLKVRHGDTVFIPGGLDHAQVSAPGYGMYYLWIVRHLPRRPYRGFTFTPAHTWLLDPKCQGWRPARSR